MYYVGIDYHKKISYGTMMDERGKIVRQGMIKNSGGGIRSFFDGLDDEVIAVMEATRNWTLMYDWLDKIADKVKLAHPLKVKAIAEAKIKTDKIDSTTLAHLLRCDLLPEAYVPTKSARDARQILRQRMFFVRVQTMLKNRIRGIIDRHPEVGSPKVKDIFGKEGMKWLKRVQLPAPESKLIDGDIRLLEAVRERIRQSDKLVEELGKANERVKYLRSIPGVGKFFAVLICHEIDDINRFRTAKKLHAYAGIIPSTYASGDRVFHGRITKQGNKWLRWALIEAAWPAIRTDAGLRYFYERLRVKKGANVAKVATARRLLTIVYKVLKEERYYKVHGCPDVSLAVSR